MPAAKPYPYKEPAAPAAQPSYKQHGDSSEAYYAAPKPSKRYEYEYTDPYGKPSSPFAKQSEHEYYAPAPKPKGDYYAPKPKDDYYPLEPRQDYYAPQPKEDYVILKEVYYAPKPKEDYYEVYYDPKPRQEYYQTPAPEAHKHPEAPAKPVEQHKYFSRPGYQPPVDKPQDYTPKDSQEPEYYYKPGVDGYSKDSEYFYSKTPEGQQYYDSNEYYSKDSDCGPGRGGHYCELCPVGGWLDGCAGVVPNWQPANGLAAQHYCRQCTSQQDPE